MSLLAACLALLWGVAPARAQTPDTTATLQLRSMPEGHSPRGALWRAAALPGWGQVYNRQYYKLPVVYLGLGGIAGMALYNNHRYLLLRHAYLYAEPRLRDADGTSQYRQYEDDYLTLLDELGIPRDQALQRRDALSNVFRQNRDLTRRNRDLLYIGVGLFYGLTVLDAYVSAHLLDFDVGEDLTASLIPVPNGVALTLRSR